MLGWPFLGGFQRGRKCPSSGRSLFTARFVPLMLELTLPGLGGIKVTLYAIEGIYQY